LPGLFLLGLAGCVAAPAEPLPGICLLPSQRSMMVAELFFGRDRAGREPVSDGEWGSFLDTVITPNFPDGLTVFDGYGQWRNQETGVIGHSPHVKIVLVAVKRSPDLPERFNAVMEAYKTRFQQKSVGLITRDSCAAF
jgi:hypothetical protein